MLLNPPTTSLIIPGQCTVATLPNAALYLRRYIWCTDLHDGQPDYLISDGAKWKPVRPLATRSISGDANMTLSPLANAPTQILTGTISAVRTIAFATTNAYSGARFRVLRKATGLLGIVANATTLPVNGWADFEFDGTAWMQTASGGLL